MDVFLVIVAIVLLLVGLVGGILPVLPGPPISFCGYLATFFISYSKTTWQELLIFAVITIIVTLIDYALPAIMTRRFGGSRAGSVGATLGLIGGIFFFPPWGVFVGPFVGAVLGVIPKNSED